MAKSIFTDSEIEFIKDNYKLMSNKDMAVILNKHPKQIKGKLDTLRLRIGVVMNTFEEHEVKFIADNYNKVETSQIAKSLNRTVKQINDKAYNMGLKRDLFRHEYDEGYFEVIDSEEKAYWLGFLYADGCISQIFNNKTGALKGQSVDIGLSIEDKNHLEKFSRRISNSKEVVTRKISLKGKTFESCRLQIYNKKICSDLIKLGCTPSKSLTIEFPSENIVPKELVHHFVRGYFDGDGCVSSNHDKRFYIINFVGTKNFLEKVSEYALENEGLSKTKITRKGEAYQISWGGFHNLEKWYNLLYKDATVYLERKKSKFIDTIDSKEYVRDVAYYHRNVMV